MTHFPRTLQTWTQWEMTRGTGGKVHVCLQKEQDRQEFNQNGLRPHWEGETVIGTVSVRVFDVSTTNLIYPMNHVCEDIVFTWQPSPQPSISVFLYPHQWETSKSPDILGCLVFSWWWFTVHTPSHVSSDVYTFMYPLETVCQRCGPLVLHAL